MASSTSSAGPTSLKTISADACGDTTFGATPPSMSRCCSWSRLYRRLEERQCPQPHERVDEQVDRGDAVLGKRASDTHVRVRSSLIRNTPRRERRELAVGGLAVDQECGCPEGDSVRQRGAVAAALLADDEQQADPAFATGAAAARRAASCAARIPSHRTHPRPMQPSVAHAGWNERRHAVEVRGETTTADRPACAQMFEAAASHGLLDNRIAAIAQHAQPANLRPRARGRSSSRCR